MRISDGGVRHVQRVNNLLKVRGGAIRRNLISENGEEFDGEGKAKRTRYLTKRIDKSHDERSDHMIINKRSKTDLRTIMEQLIRNRSKNNHRTTDRKPIMGTIIERLIGN